MRAITVFTPTYNRCNLLERCYKSMKRQTSSDFVWMIIDDGSTDDTREIVSGWIKEHHNFEIEYYYKENGGLHTAYNEAISHIQTPLCVCIDSDDYMPDNAVERIIDYWNQYGNENYAGIVGLDYTIEGDLIGDPFPPIKSINLIDLMVGKYPIKNGDRTNVVRSELYKKYAPMKVFPGEKNFNPHYLHLQISQEYDFLVLNENLRYVEYQSDGMSASMFKQYLDSPNSFIEHRKLYLNFPNTSFKFKFRHSIHLVSSCIHLGDLRKAIEVSPCKIITICAIPFGWLLSVYIRKKVKKEK